MRSSGSRAEKHCRFRITYAFFDEQFETKTETRLAKVRLILPSKYNFVQIVGEIEFSDGPIIQCDKQSSRPVFVIHGASRSRHSVTDRRPVLAGLPPRPNSDCFVIGY